MFSALPGHINVLFEETLHRYIPLLPLQHSQIAKTVASIPSLFTDPHRNSFRWTAEPTKARGSNQTQKYCLGSSESQPPETFNHEVNPNHLKGVQSPASRGEERKWLSRVLKKRVYHTFVKTCQHIADF